MQRRVPRRLGVDEAAIEVKVDGLTLNGSKNVLPNWVYMKCVTINITPSNTRLFFSGNFFTVQLNQSASCRKEHRK